MQPSDSVPVPKTSQELEQAIQQYRSSNWQGRQLFLRWQAIRLAAIAQSSSDLVGDQVPGEDSY